MERLIGAFRTFDGKADGTVSREAMEVILTTLGTVFTKQEINEFVVDADPSDSGVIHYEKFVRNVWATYM